ncbi:hypothetical protein Patl1_14978 [Pistacia atlantica]|uniref:Uncharacterized protein n=2 Tax=Pistacia atlantica TaxID=434234 RepID=A0ACC1BA22_9ROSI|nr:hypothetical protein Patl1_14981 [Pistacia atlantica]KAJ0096077.1 hypothetical protein Patl1_14978 [Pistacia atlantica]
MEIPVVNRIIDFETNIDSLPLHNPSLLSQVSAVSGLGKLHQVYSFWKWGALILALIASFTTIVTKIKLLILRLQKYPYLAPQFHHPLLDDSDYDSDTDVASCSSSDDEQEYDLSEDDEDDTAVDQNDFRVRGSGHVYMDEQWQNRNLGLRRRCRRSIGDFFSWSELTGGKSVVKLWDNLGLGLGLNVEDDDTGNVSGNMLTIYDMNNEREIRNIATDFHRKHDIPAFVATSSACPSVIFSAAENEGGGVALSGWDMRIGSKLPAILAEWRPKLGNIVGGVKAGGVAKLYVRDNVNSALAVGDMRKVNSPLEDVTENDVDTWWDADAVIVTEDCFQEST